MGRVGSRDIWVIYGAILLVGIAYGTSISVLALHLHAHGIAKSAMGALAASFALGIVAFAVPAGAIVARFGAKAALSLALLGYAGCVATFPLLDTFAALAFARFLDGAFSAHVWVSAETALLSRARGDNRGVVMGLYAIAMALGYVAGPLLSSQLVAHATTSSAFLVAGALAMCASGVVGLGFGRGERGEESAEDAPQPAGTRAPTKPSGIGGILWKTKTSCAATFTYGYFQASVVLFLPLYLMEAKNVREADTVLVTAFFALGMLLVSTWAGRMGDAHGHLRTMRVLAAIGGTMVASFPFLPSFSAMGIAVFVAGATLASISPVSLALQGVVAKGPDLGRANALYNGAYALGMLLGPPLSGALFTRWGGAAMLFHLAVLWAGFVALCTFFATDDPRTRAAPDAAPAFPMPPEVRSATSPAPALPSSHREALLPATEEP